MNKYTKIEMTDEFEQILIGSSLGDGSFTKISHGAANSKFSLAHTTDQKEYFMYKYEIFEKHGVAGKLSENRIYNKRYKKGYFDEIRFRSKTHPLFTEYRRKLYPTNGKGKKLNIEILHKLKPLGLAIWYMDDGNVTNNSFSININRYNREEAEQLKKYLWDVFYLNFHINRNGDLLYLLAECRDIFKEIIEEHIIPSMQHKLKPYLV